MRAWPVLLLAAGLQATSDPSVDQGPHAVTTESHTRLRPGRHVCNLERERVERMDGGTVKRFEAYKKPTYESYSTRCQDKICQGVRVVYETAYRDVEEVTREPPTYRCCPGWSQAPRDTLGCNNAVCTKPCLNGGKCLSPDVCTCPSGFTGLQCEQDIDECQMKTTCLQLCSNTPGSYKCSCRHGYKLEPDLRSCFKKGKNKTLDGKFDIEIIARKVAKLEKMMRKNSKYELQTELSENPSIDELQASVDTLQKRIETLSRQHQETWRKMSSKLEELRPLGERLDALENRLSQCTCKCKDHRVFTRTFRLI